MKTVQKHLIIGATLEYNIIFPIPFKRLKESHVL